MLKHVLAVISIVCFMSSKIAIAAGKCEFFAKASIGVLEFTGTGCTIEGSPKVEGGKVSGEFSVDLSKLDTGMSLKLAASLLASSRCMAWKSLLRVRLKSLDLDTVLNST